MGGLEREEKGVHEEGGGEGEHAVGAVKGGGGNRASCGTSSKAKGSIIKGSDAAADSGKGMAMGMRVRVGEGMEMSL